MGWFLRTITSSLGKKLVIATTGLIFCLFLTMHLFGNLTIFSGGEAVNSYSERLHALGSVLKVVEVVLLASALLHISFAALLYFENLWARPVKYVMKKNAGGRTLSSATMPYSGLFLLVFVIVHLITFRFVDRTNQTIFDLITKAFSSPAYVIFYTAAVVAAAFHVKHGLWSGFQSLGASHPKYMPLVKGASFVFSLIIGVGFGALPIFIFVSA